MNNKVDLIGNNPKAIIRLGSNQDTCIICYNEAINEIPNNKDIRDATDRWHYLEKLKGKFEYQPMFKLRHLGNDICICHNHIKEVYTLLEDVNTKQEKAEKEEVKEEKKDAKKKD